MAVCLSFHLTDFILEVLIHISTTLTLMLVQLVQSQCDWCGTEYGAVCCTDSVTETLWFCSHDSVFRNIFTEHKVTQRETLIPISPLLPHHSSPLPLNPASCPKAQAAGWEVGGKLSQVPLFDRAVAAFVLQAKPSHRLAQTPPQRCWCSKWHRQTCCRVQSVNGAQHLLWITNEENHSVSHVPARSERVL